MGWSDVLSDVFSNEFLQTVGDYVIPDFIFEAFDVSDATKALVDQTVGDALAGAVAGGTIAALTGGDVLTGAGVGAGVGGVGNLLMDKNGLDVGSMFDGSGGSDTSNDVIDNAIGDNSGSGGIGSISSGADGSVARADIQQMIDAGNKKELYGGLLTGAVGGISQYYKQKDQEKEQEKQREAARTIQEDRQQHEEYMYDKQKAKYDPNAQQIKAPTLSIAQAPSLNAPSLSPVQMQQLNLAVKNIKNNETQGLLA